VELSVLGRRERADVLPSLLVGKQVAPRRVSTHETVTILEMVFMSLALPGARHGEMTGKAKEAR
jgi:hypothetical protein